jgi:murein L,D-transpeptidase YafK
MTLFREGQPIKTYEVALGREPGPKRREGDNKTPEGLYRISGRNPQSAYHLSLRISYPVPHEVAAAKARGEPPGGDIMIHSIRNGLGWLGSLHRQQNWTAGCIAVTNGEIEEIWRAVPDGSSCRESCASGCGLDRL